MMNIKVKHNKNLIRSNHEKEKWAKILTQFDEVKSLSWLKFFSTS